VAHNGRTCADHPGRRPCAAPAGTGHAKNPETKRRFKNLLGESGLWKKLAVHDADPVTMKDLRRVHTDGYLAFFKAVSDAGGGNAERASPFGRWPYEIAMVSAGLVKRQVQHVLENIAFDLVQPIKCDTLS
jgi:acetoin utilization deacetylase AcuC-like enzyme